ncbi:MAG: photosystem II protein PsbQ [Synechococcaceae cyanobacterium RM1_1_27]|nr:photosystem II protein PsbQ [Synechococcaceae cyanobacterium SM2_3_2]NJO85639.1 photosystem II protein PsbQ [Synechococcaceae cyanobacterium RM1_1_27]
MTPFSPLTSMPMAMRMAMSTLSQWLYRLVMAVFLLCLLTFNVGAVAQAAPIPPQLNRLEAQINELQTLIDARDWPEIRFYLNGPMGYTRKDLSSISQSLPQNKRQMALRMAREITDRMVDIDQGSRQSDSAEVATAQRALREAVQTFRDLVANS